MEEFREVDGRVDARDETGVEMFGAESSRRSRRRVVAVLVAVALAAGVGGLAYALAGGDAGVVDTGPLTTPIVSAVPAATPDGHMVPLWLPERLVVRNAGEEGAQPCATTPAVGSTTANPAIQAGPGVCVVALTVLYYAPSIPSDGFVRFVEARATDVRTPLMTEATTVRGKRGALYRSRTGPSPSGPSLEALSLFWQEDA